MKQEGDEIQENKENSIILQTDFGLSDILQVEGKEFLFDTWINFPYPLLGRKLGRKY